ncbi:MAG: amino acid permease [Verrucomicrobiota bacterium]
MTPSAKPGSPAATALVIASMIGTGVFASLGFQLVDFDSAPQILSLWVIGGVIALCGALSYATLAEVLPRSGGEYHYLGKIYHPSLGFMAGLLSAIVGFTAPTAITALVLGGYLHKAHEGIPAVPAAMFVIVLGAFAHGLSARTSARVQLVSTCLKLALIIGLITAAAILPGKGDIRWTPDFHSDFAVLASPALAVALYFVFYAFSGWNAAVYGLEEWREPGKTIRRALIVGTVIVSILYVGLNAAFLAAAPVSALRGNQELAHAAAAALFGETTGRVVSLLFAIGLFASVSALLWAGPRVLGAMAREVPALRWFSSTRQVPLRPLVFQTLLALVFVCVADFQFLVTYTQTGLALCTFLCACGVFILRTRGHAIPTSALIPAGLFATSTAFVLVWSFFVEGAAPMMIGLVTALACALLWYPLHRLKS